MTQPEPPDDPPGETAPEPGAEPAGPRWRRPQVVLASAAALVLVAVVAAAALWPDGDDATGAPAPTEAPVVTPTLTTPAAEPAADLSAEEIADRYGDSVWRVDAEGCGYDVTGSAFAIGPTTLVTTAHVVINDPEPQVLSRDGEEPISVEVVGADPDTNVAVLEAERTLPGTPLDWDAADSLDEGQALVALGYSVVDGEFQVVPSTLAGFQTGGDAREALQLDGIFDKGGTGGPALTGSGRVAGVVSHLAGPSHQLVPAAHTSDHLADVLDSIEQQRPGHTPGCDDGPTVAAADEEWSAPESPGRQWYGDDADLDGLHDDCAGGEMPACDELFWLSPYGSEYESFALTCGGTGVDAAYGTCAWSAGDVEQPSTDGDSADDERSSVGDDADLDELWTACEGGDLAACDELYAESPEGSEYREFAATCGGAGQGDGNCAGEGQDDPFLDELYDACAESDLHACDDLFFYAPVGSAYEEFGSTCGGRREPTEGNCAL